MELPITFSWLSQATLILGIVVCIAITKTYVSGKNKGGVSNYGTDRKTTIPFSLAFILEGIFLIGLAISLPAAVISALRVLLYIEASLVFLTLVSTYKYKSNNILKIVHIAVAGILLCYQSALSIYLLCRLTKGPIIVAALTIEVVGIVICLGSLTKLLRNLFVGQVLAALGFALLLVTAIPKAHIG